MAERWRARLLNHQGSNFESCVWRTVSSHSSHHSQEVLMAQFSLYVNKDGLNPRSFLYISFYTPYFCHFLQHAQGTKHERSNDLGQLLIINTCNSLTTKIRILSVFTRAVFSNKLRYIIGFRLVISTNPKFTNINSFLIVLLSHWVHGIYKQINKFKC